MNIEIVIVALKWCWYTNKKRQTNQVIHCNWISFHKFLFDLLTLTYFSCYFAISPHFHSFVQVNSILCNMHKENSVRTDNTQFMDGIISFDLIYKMHTSTSAMTLANTSLFFRCILFIQKLNNCQQYIKLRIQVVLIYMLLVFSLIWTLNVLLHLFQA